MPQPFQNAVITNAGANLLTRAQAGEANIEFTRIAIGDGIYTETEKEVPSLQAQSALKSEKNSYPLSNIEIHNEHSVKVTALLTNQDPNTQETRVTVGYFINEMGLFAKVKDGDSDTEVLYSIAVTAGETGDFMPPYNGQYPAQIIQEYYATVNNSAEVIIQSNNGAVALADDLQKYFPKLNANVEGYSYPSNCICKQGIDLNEITESGLYFCSNPVNAPNNNGNGFMIAITYDGKTRGMQIYMPVSENMIYKRQNTSGIWGSWGKIKVGSAEAATKVTQDGNGNDIVNTYAKKSVYGDSIMSLGRKSETTVGDLSAVSGGNSNTASSSWSTVSGGQSNNATGTRATVIGGGYNTASGTCAVSGGYNNTASGDFAVAGGSNNTASGVYAVVSGGQSNKATGENATVSGGRLNNATKPNSTVSGGSSNTASGNCAVVSGGSTNIASSSWSAALGGSDNAASGASSVTLGGCSLISENNFSVACGHYNARMVTGGTISDTTGTAFVIGNGTYASALSNAFSVMFNGVVKAKSTITGSTTADYAEFFEWLDGNPNNEDRVGKFVTLVGNKIAIANSNTDYILGIVSGEPFVLGNGDCDTWNGMYMKDDFNRTIYEPAPKMEVDEETGNWVSVVDEKGNLVYEGTRPKLNPEYDPEQYYISRFDRKEWSPVGMLGVLSVIDDGSCQVDGFCCCSKDGIATACEKETEGACRVTERISENVVRVVLK